MSTESKGKHRVKDMSFKPEEVKVKSKEPEVAETGDKKAVVVTRKERKSPDRRPSHHRGHGKVSNWVCVKKGDEVLRVQRATVEAKYINAGWNYCPRKEWKASGATQVASVTSEKPSKKSKKKVQEA